MAFVFILSQEASKLTCIVSGDRGQTSTINVPSASNIKLGGGQRTKL